MISIRVVAMVVLVVLIIVVAYYMMKPQPPSATHCTTPGAKAACPDTWSGTSETYKLCGNDLNWVTTDTYGPGGCKVSCSDPSMKPCDAPSVMACIPENSVCGACDSESCGANGVCDKSTGKCACNAGYSGDSCETHNGSWKCQTNADCGRGGTCQLPDGLCKCGSTWTTNSTNGLPCDACLDGFGPSPDYVRYDWGGVPELDHRFPTVYDTIPKPNTAVNACSYKLFEHNPVTYTTLRVPVPGVAFDTDEVYDNKCKQMVPGSNFTGKCGKDGTDYIWWNGQPNIQCTLDRYYALPNYTIPETVKTAAASCNSTTAPSTMSAQTIYAPKT